MRITTKGYLRNVRLVGNNYWRDGDCGEWFFEINDVYFHSYTKRTLADDDFAEITHGPLENGWATGRLYFKNLKRRED